MSSSVVHVAEYAAALKLCHFSTPQRRLLDSLVLKTGVEEGVKRFLMRHSLLPGTFETLVEEQERIMAGHSDIRAVEVTDRDYPTRLRNIPSPPGFLFVRGRPAILERRCVAIVGTRRASDVGLALASKIAADLASRGVVVVSGLARGIDAMAHRAALAQGDDSTCAVVGTPLDRVYPAEHRELQDEIFRRGVVVSHFPSGVAVSKFNFPERNRLMAGLSEATLVVEAGDTSGAVIQARQCLSLGRILFLSDIVRGNPELRWPSNYLDRGARVANSADDVIDCLDRL